MADLDDLALDEEVDHDAFFSGHGGVDAPAEDLLNVMKSFVTDYSKSLGEVREALSANDTEAWEMENDIINLATHPVDTVSPIHMIGTENSQLNKVALVFSVLMIESKELSRTAAEKFYGGLTMFGHTLEGMSGEEEEDAKPVSPEAQMGTFLPFLTDLLNFIQRVYKVGHNLVNQLACLYHERQRLYITTFKQVHLESVFQALGELCRILITLDAIITDNAAIDFGWSAYKRMIKYIRADPDKYGVDNPKLRSFEKLLVQLDRQVLSCKVFEGFLAQDFGLPGTQNYKALIAGNRVLSEEFSYTITALFKRYSSGIGKRKMK
jgi:WASH complex subunit 7